MFDIDLGMYTSFDIFYYFVIFSFLGWILELGYTYYHEKKFANRGFLHGPFCPIYGFAIILIFVIASVLNLVNFNINLFNIAILFISTMLIATILEFIVGYILMIVFKQRWWDYSDLKYQISGYISLRFSLYWGIGGTILYVLLDTFKLNRGVSLPRPMFDYFGVIIFMIFVIDFTKSIDLALRLKKFTSDFSNATKQLRKRIESADIDLDFSRVREFIQEGKLDELLDEISEDLTKARKETRIILNRALNRYNELLNENRIKPFKHFLKAFPNIKSLYDESLFNTLRKRLDLPVVKFSISRKEQYKVIHGNFNNSDETIYEGNYKDARWLKILSSREAWPNLSMKTVIIQRGGFIEKKNHNNSHLYILINGNCEINSENTNYSLSSGDYIYFPKNQPHKISNKYESKATLIDIIPNDKSKRT